MQTAAFFTPDQKTTGTNFFVIWSQFLLINNRDHKAWQKNYYPELI